ncbi:DUF4890 domain-containing protein [Dyadobacter tibetensis]|uniref:DUF4890 domain-containing protein n=1 Tax=Dyadobacter tibetensis TaxID=1211851 RepID=UPI000470B5C9|nr:DUF4890 domain-containing protein [Dyadobacter tibetensis]
MKKVLMMVLLFASTTAFAQRPNQGGTPEQQAEKQTARLTESLKLSEEQKKQVYDLNLKRMTTMSEMRKAENMDRSKMKESNEVFNAELAKILSPEQQEKLKAMESERKGQGQGGRQGRPRN